MMIKLIVSLFVFAFPFVQGAAVIPNSSTILSRSAIPSRRILQGHQVGETRPYMVYLRPAPTPDGQQSETWLCGGVIIHERFVLTSAACIEDVKHFYVVSGTNKWVSGKDQSNECIKNGAKKAVWKCVPQSYYYDGNDFENIRWMSNDLAVVKVEDDFNFKRRVRGCDYIPRKIAFNNYSLELEKSGTVGSIAGWGSTSSFGDVIGRTSTNSPVLLETDVVLISKKNCKKRWQQRYHHIIDESMVCAKDAMDSDAMRSICSENEVNCKELVYSDEEDEEGPTRRMMADPKEFHVHSAIHNDTRRSKITSGGFCENDHGGPLVVGQGASAVVVGVISACQTRDVSRKCFGPFLYTSVYRNRHLLSCAIEKEIGATCRRLLKTMNTQISSTSFEWDKHPDGPPKAIEGATRKTTIPSVLRSMKTTKRSH